MNLNYIRNKLMKKTDIKEEPLSNTDPLMEQVTSFIANPESLMLYRGEKDCTRGGLHFTPNKEWAKGFGEILLEGRLPSGSRVKLIVPNDLDDAVNHGLVSDREFHRFLLTKGYDAIIGHDVMNSKILDVVIHPKHLENFKVSTI